MTRPGIEPRSPGPLANTLTAGPFYSNFIRRNVCETNWGGGNKEGKEKEEREEIIYLLLLLPLYSFSLFLDLTTIFCIELWKLIWDICLLVPEVSSFESISLTFHERAMEKWVLTNKTNDLVSYKTFLWSITFPISWICTWILA